LPISALEQIVYAEGILITAVVWGLELINGKCS